MGVRGLMSFFLDQSDIYLSPYKLRDSYLVIDGSNLAWFLCRNGKCANSIGFGGDYDLYYSECKDFFQRLKTCNVIPIVVLDGGHTPEREVVLMKRRRETLEESIRNPFNLAGTVFAKNVFSNVLNELKIMCVRCVLDADKEIASIAKYLTCPILSFDSDFFVYDVLFIPLSTLVLEVVNDEDVHLSSYLSCSLFDQENLLRVFDGLEKSVLPILGALLGFNNSDAGIFQNIFKNIHIKAAKGQSMKHRKIASILSWLRFKNPTKAIEDILKHLKKVHQSEAAALLEAVIKMYEISTPEHMATLKKIPALQGSETIVHKGNVDLLVKEQQLLPAHLVESWNDLKLFQGASDLFLLGKYFPFMQVEDVKQCDSHSPAYPIMGALSALVLCDSQSKRWTLNCRKGTTLTFKVISAQDYFHYFTGIDIRNINDEPKSLRSKIFFDVLGFSENDKNIILNIDNDWALFIISLIYWAKALSTKITSQHIYGLLLMALIVFSKSKFSHYETYSQFMRARKKSLQKFQLTKASETVSLNDLEVCLFSDAFKHIPNAEYSRFIQLFFHFKEVEADVKSKCYSVSVLHLFACFQSCLFHIQQLNILLGYVFPYINVEKFYSGRVLYNIYIYFSNIKDLMDHLENILADVPNIKNMFKLLIKKLNSYISSSRGVSPLEKKKTKKSKFKAANFQQKEGIRTAVETCS